MSVTGITVPGTAGGNIVVSTGTGDYLKLAQQMASVLNAAKTGSNLSVSTVTAGSFVPNAPVTSNTTELGIVGAGGAVAQTAGTGWNYIINVPSSPDTVVASNAQVLSGDAGSTIYVSGTSTVAATGGNNLISAQGTYLISTATGNDTIFASGSGTIAPGAGANFVDLQTGNNYVISAGTGDQVYQESGNASVNAIGTNATVIGSNSSSNTLVATLGGSGNQVFAGATQAFVSVSGTSAGVFGGGTANGTLTILDTGTLSTISQNADSVMSATVSGANGNAEIFGGGIGTTLNLQLAGSVDGVLLGAGTSVVTMSGGNNFFYGQNGGSPGGSLSLDATGSSNLIALNNEATSNVTLGGSNSTVFGGAGTLNISISGSADTVYAGTGTGVTTVTTSSNPLVYAPVGHALQFIGGAGVPTLVGGAGGTMQVTVGSGGMILDAATNGSSTITAGVGQVTVFGTGNSVTDLIGTASGGARFQAYGGNETLSGAGATSGNSFWASTITGANVDLIGGTGPDTMSGGAGNTTMTGGGGSDLFVAFAQNTSVAGSGAHITITDFNSNDTVYLLNYDTTKSASYLLANATGPGVTGTGAGVTLTLSDNTTVTFTNLTSETPLYGKILYS